MSDARKIERANGIRRTTIIQLGLKRGAPRDMFGLRWPVGPSHRRTGYERDLGLYESPMNRPQILGLTCEFAIAFGA
jgi:hypothetical protein